MIPDRLQIAFDEAWQAMTRSVVAESAFFDRVGDFMNKAVAINDAVAEINRAGGGDELTAEENARLKKMVDLIQQYSVHLAALAQTRAAHPFQPTPSDN